MSRRSRRELGVAEATVIPPKDEAILRGAAALGWKSAADPPERGELRRLRHAARSAAGAGTKRSGIRVHLADAHAAGARIVPRVRVTRVLLEGGRAVGVEGDATWTDPATGEPAADGRTRRLVVRAPVVVLAAGALRTPAILQAIRARASGDRPPPAAPSGPDRRRPLPAADRHVARHDAGRPLARVRRTGAGNNGYVIESAPGHPGLLALALPWEGPDAHADVMLRARRIAPLIAVTRDGGEGRATLTRAGRVRVDYRLDASGVATLRHGLVSMARLARAAGASEIVAVGTPPAWHGRAGFAAGGEAAAFARFEAALASFDFRPNRGSVFSAHQMGSVRMGDDAADASVRPVGTGPARRARRSASSAGSTSRTGRCSRRASGSTR